MRGPGLTPSTTNKQNVRLRLAGEEGEYHSLGLWLCLRLCSSLISLSLSGGSPLLPRTGQLTSTVGYEAAQVCRWGLPGSAAGLGEGWVPPPLLLPGGRACWLPSLPSDQPPPHLHSHTHAAPGDIPHQELKPKHKFSISQGPGCTALLGPSKALCYPLWPRIRLFAWDWELQVNKLKSRQDKSHSDSVCWTSSRQELYAPCPQFWAPALMSAYTLAYTSGTHQQTTVPKHKPKHTLFSICKDGLHLNPFL